MKLSLFVFLTMVYTSSLVLRLSIKTHIEGIPKVRNFFYFSKDIEQWILPNYRLTEYKAKLFSVVINIKYSVPSIKFL